MYKTLFLLTVLALAPVSNAFADKASREENIGVSSGAIIGAAAGGPVGFIIGAAIGAKVGDTMHQKRTTIDSLNASIADSRTELVSLEREIRARDNTLDALSDELTRVRAEGGNPALTDLMQAGIAMDLLFRTDEFALADATGSRLVELADSVATMPDIHVQLDGYADERGDADYNLQLSQKRVDFVRDQLIAAGIDPARIRVAAHGESPAQDATADSFALERRVSLKLFIADSESFASTPN